MKKLIIETCQECRFLMSEKDGDGAVIYCSLDVECRDVFEPLHIPEWCPLPDSTEDDNDEV